MLSLRVNRQWVCLAVGGGVTGDLAGFAASVYMRGIPVVQAATTLLAQVDSSIGGKTAVNTKFGKNLVGTFYQPLFVLSDTAFLATLDPAQMRSAMAEVIKYGVIMDAPLFEYIENGPPFDYQKIVTMCSRDKARVVGLDEREGGLRRILNFGHTLGHAVEKSTDYTVLHGLAVGVGMLFASWLSRERNLLPDVEYQRIRRVILREGVVPEGLSLPPEKEVARAMALDKKAAGKGVHFVLTPSIGDVSVQKLSEIEVMEAYKGFADGYARGL
jgi:3-dehydroquinate synthase